MLRGDSNWSGSFSMNEMREVLDNVSFRQDEQMAELRLIRQVSLPQLHDELSSCMEHQGQQLAQILASFNSSRRPFQKSVLGGDELSILDSGGGDGKVLFMKGDESSCERDVAEEVVAFPWSPQATKDTIADCSGPASKPMKHVPSAFTRKGVARVRMFSDDKWRNKLRARSSHDCPGVQDTGVRKFVKAQWFDYISAVLVIANAIFIGVQVEYIFHTSETPLLISIVDYIFCVAFACELFLRLYAYGRLEFFFGDNYAWNWFDFLIVSLSTLDTIVSIIVHSDQTPLGNILVLRTVRIVRVTRVLRIIRVMKFFRDLRIMVAAISSTLKTATWALFLLWIAMYMFGIVITQTAGERAQDKEQAGTPLDDDEPLLIWFGSLPRSLFTLFMSISGGIDYEHAAKSLFELPLSLCIYMLYILFSSVCVMNVVTGMFCQSAIETFENDKENIIRCQLAEKTRFVERLADMFREWDINGDGHCTKEEFEKNISEPRMQSLLQSLDIDSRDAMQLFGMMDFEDKGCLDLEEFIHGCITLRGSAKAVHMERVIVDNKLTREKLDKLIACVSDIRSKVNDSVLTACSQPLELGPCSRSTAGKSHVAAVETPNLLESKEPVVTRNPRAHFEIAEVPHSRYADRAVAKSRFVEIHNIQPPSSAPPIAPTQERAFFSAPGVFPDS